MKDKKLLPMLLTLGIVAVIAIGSFIFLRTGESAEADLTETVDLAAPSPNPKSTAAEENSIEPVSGGQPTTVRESYHYAGSIIESTHEYGTNYYRLTFFNDTLITDQAIGVINSSGENYESMESGLYKIDNGENKIIDNTYEFWSEEDGGLMLHFWTADNEGVIYIIYSDEFSNNSSQKYLRIIDSNGDITADMIPFEFNVNPPVIWEMKVYDGKIYTKDGYHQLHINSLDGKRINNDTIPLLESYGDFDIDPYGGLYILSSHLNNTLLYKYDLSLNELIYSETLPYSNTQSLFYDKKTDSVNVVCNTNVIRVNAEDGKNAIEEVVFETDIPYITGHYVTGGYVFNDFITDTEGNFFISLSGAEEALIYKLTKTPGERPAREAVTELIITGVYKPPYIEEAITRYAKVRPDVSISWDILYPIYNEGREALSNGNAIQQYNAKIMANDVGDIVLTGGVGAGIYDLFITDAFIDLSDYIKNDKSYPSLNKAVLDGLLINNQIKGLPLGLAPFYFTVDNDVMNEIGLTLDTFKDLTWSEMMRLAIDNPVGEDGVFFAFVPVYYLLNIIRSNNHDLINIEQKTVDLHQDWLVDSIELFKEMVNTPGVLMNENASPDSISKHLFRFITDSYDITHAFGRTIFFNEEVLQLSGGEVNRNMIIRPFEMCSISANTTKQDEAWEFLSFMAEAEQQALSSLLSTPLNLEAIERRYDMLGGIPEEIKEKTYDFMNGYDYTYDVYYYNHDIAEPIMQYVDGEITLDEALDTAEQNVMFRLNE